MNASQAKSGRRPIAWPAVHVVAKARVAGASGCQGEKSAFQARDVQGKLRFKTVSIHTINRISPSEGSEHVISAIQP